MLDVLDARVAQAPVVDDAAHRLFPVGLVVGLAEQRRRDDQRLVVVHQRHAAAGVALPPLAGERVGAAVGEDALEPALEDGGEVQPEHRRDERQPVGGGDLLPLLAGVLGRVLADEAGDLRRALVAQPARRDTPPDRSAGDVVQDALLEVHRVEDVRRHVLVQVAGHVARAEHRVELDRVKVHHLHPVPGLAQAGRELLQHGVAERLRVRVRVDRQDLHGRTPVYADLHISGSPTLGRTHP